MNIPLARWSGKRRDGQSLPETRPVSASFSKAVSVKAHSRVLTKSPAYVAKHMQLFRELNRVRVKAVMGDE